MFSSNALIFSVYPPSFLTVHQNDSVTLLGEYLKKNGKETPFCSII